MVAARSASEDRTKTHLSCVSVVHVLHSRNVLVKRCYWSFISYKKQHRAYKMGHTHYKVSSGIFGRSGSRCKCDKMCGSVLHATYIHDAQLVFVAETRYGIRSIKLKWSQWTKHCHVEQQCWKYICQNSKKKEQSNIISYDTKRQTTARIRHILGSYEYISQHYRTLWNLVV